MDMRMKLGPWLTGGVVNAMGGRYQGTIGAVEERQVRNKWTTKTTLEPVVLFEDGKQLVLSPRTQLELINRFGHESDAWTGKQIVIGCRAVKRTDAKTGQALVTWEKFLLPVEGENATGEAPLPNGTTLNRTSATPLAIMTRTTALEWSQAPSTGGEVSEGTG